MNDKDKEAFEQWHKERNESLTFNKFIGECKHKYSSEIAWQAACEYKQDEIDKLNKINDHLVNQLMYALEFKEVEEK